MPIIETETKTGEPQLVGNHELTPLTQVLKIQLPGHHGGVIWNRPKAVVVRTADGQEQTLPIPDVTRITIWAMLAGGLLGAIAIGLLFRNK
jgi:hypothetical protein